MLIFPDYALKCLEKLNENGFEAYFVGGCVRDLICGKMCNDIDITTSALPNDIINIFEKTVPTGIKHGTVTVLIDNEPIEVTTFRTECGYEDSRHPSNINFVKNITEDLKRRDFTINALAYNPKIGLVDLFGGLDDIKNRIVKTVGNAEDRFNEDALRILRAYRFSSVLDFEIDEKTKTAALKLGNKLALVSGERVYSELGKLIIGSRPECILPLIKNGFLKPFGINSLKVDDALLFNLKNINADAKTKFALFVFLCNHNLTEIKEKLHVENKTYKAVDFFNSIKYISVPKSKIELKRFMSCYKNDKTSLFFSFLELLSPDDANHLSGLKSEIEANLEPYLIPHLAINGQYLLDNGFSGKDVGKMLNSALEYVIKYPNKNNTDDLKTYLEI